MKSWLDLLGYCMYFFGPPKLQSRTTKGKLIGGPNVHQCTKYYFEDWWMVTKQGISVWKLRLHPIDLHVDVQVPTLICWHACKVSNPDTTRSARLSLFKFQRQVDQNILIRWICHSSCTNNSVIHLTQRQFGQHVYDFWSRSGSTNRHMIVHATTSLLEMTGTSFKTQQRIPVGDVTILEVTCSWWGSLQWPSSKMATGNRLRRGPFSLDKFE